VSSSWTKHLFEDVILIYTTVFPKQFMYMSKIETVPCFMVTITEKLHKDLSVIMVCLTKLCV